MTPSTARPSPADPSPPRQVAACPWCGAGSELGVAGDGFGAVALACKRCGARGPSVPIGSDFGASDEVAIAHWSTRARPAAPAGLGDRVRIAIGLHRLTGTLTPDAPIPVAFSDLDLLLKVAGA